MVETLTAPASAPTPAPGLEPAPVSWALHKKLQIPPDPLRARLDFHTQAVVLTLFDDKCSQTRIVSALDVAHALANELSYSTGILPAGTIWWTNSKYGPVNAVYDPPRTRKVALQEKANGQPRRFTLPLPGLIFLCTPGQPPWVFAVKEKPEKPVDKVYHAPLCNVFANGRTCAGNIQYPTEVDKTIEWFFTSFFSPAANLYNRSKKFHENVIDLWISLDGEKEFPLDDLVQYGTVGKLMEMKGGRIW